MVRSILTSVMLVTGVMPFSPVAASAAIEMSDHPMSHYHRLHSTMRHRHVDHTGRCGGRSYGTGYHGCGTATGGPAGGLPSRN